MSDVTRLPIARGAARMAAWSVHLLTTWGAVCGVMAIIAIGEGRVRAALVWMTVALLVDGVDGVLARRLRVAEILPTFDGTLLDNLVDYLNYAVVPAYLLAEASLVPRGLEPVSAAVICLASAYQFCQAEAKTADRFFKGFPSYWNVVVYYLLLLRLEPWAAFGVVVALAALAFVPLLYIYPSRTRPLRALTLSLTAIWSAALVVMLFLYPERQPWLIIVSLLYVVYYAGMSLYLNSRRARENS
jgi:phosphatidylcholine synthase